MNYKPYYISCLLVLISLSSGLAQNDKNSTGILSGNFQSDFQYYVQDSIARFESEVPAEKAAFNGYLTLFYQKDKFRAGIRYEAYYPPLLGYPTVFRGHGIANRFITYQNDNLEITAGNFYEQFGSGSILRTLEDRFLGIDNSIDGVRLHYNHQDRVRIKGLIGEQRDGFAVNSQKGWVRGIDVEVALEQFFRRTDEEARAERTSWVIGGSYVSKYQGFDGATQLVKIIPQNVNAYAARVEVSNTRFSIYGEYVHKQADPSALNGGIDLNTLNLREGSLQLLTATYTRPGLGLTLTAKRMDNIDFRSDRTAVNNQLLINFVTANTTQHTYRLLTWYPYAAQSVAGEMSFQGDLVYSFKKGTTFGGRYGTEINLNYAIVQNLDATNRWVPGNRRFFEDFNITLNKKWSSSVKSTFKYVHLKYDKDQVEGRTGFGLVSSNTFVADILYKFAPKQSIRFEGQHLSTAQDVGNWAFGLVELGIAPHWFFYVSDEVNYVKLDRGTPINYYTAGAVYLSGSNRFELRYGRQRAGLICVGGICRIVPALTGLTFSVTSSF